MRSLLCAALLACSFAFSAVPQASDSEPAKPQSKRQPPPGVVHSVTVNGNRLYSTQDILKQLGLKPGERVTAADIEQARQKLLSTELFNNVADEFRYSGGSVPAYDITFNVTENEQLFPMRFERLGVDADALRQYLHAHVDLYSDRIPGTEGVLRRYTAAVQQFVSQHDPSLKVKAQVSNEDPQQLAVLFTSSAPPPAISQVLVFGNKAVDTGTILRAVNQVAIGVPLTDTRLKMILDGAIKPLYAAKGYAAVTFPKIETEPAKTNLGVVVKVTIQDGPLFKFGSIRFHGSGLDQDEIRANIPFKPGQTFNSDQVDNFRLDLAHRLRRRGLLDASVTTEFQTDDSNRTVNVTYNIVPGEVYNFQKLDIDGLDITSAPVIERLWGEKQGHPFNPDYPDFFLKRVQEQGLFDNLAGAHSDYTADNSTHSVIVHLYFKGGKSPQDKAREAERERQNHQSDGTWSPWPPLQ